MPSLSGHLAAQEALKAQKELFAHNKGVGQDVPTAPAVYGWSLFALQTLVPVVLVLVTCAPAWWPAFCEKVRNLRYALSMENLRRVFHEHWHEIIGLFSVALAVLLGLLLGPGGHLATNEELDALRGHSLYSSQVVEMRKLWPLILHPDSLVLMQQLLRALGAVLLVYQGAARSGGGAFCPAFMQLAAASGMRLFLWITTTDYQPEGPLGGKFAVGCAAIAFVAQLLAANEALQAARNTSSRSKRILGFQYMIQVFLCVWAGCMNHFTVGHTDLENVMFSVIDAADLSAAPIFCIAACVGASENAPSVVGAIHVHLLAQLVGFYWYLDFGWGVASNPDSANPFIKSIKRGLDLSNSELHTSIYGDPLSLMMAAHCIQLLAMIVSFLASSGFNVGIQSNRPKAAPKHVIEQLDLVQWTSETFADDPDACCAICLGEFEEGDELRRLPCQHQQFHASCVDHWLSKAGRCPLCVADVAPEEKKEV